ncbi:MAG: hypothetical protein H6619_03120 [Deltaproteobacteria bacterium]|nr:hypothetical protein [Deltaproteobacteria bacterium]
MLGNESEGSDHRWMVTAVCKIHWGEQRQLAVHRTGVGPSSLQGTLGE